MKQFLPKSLIVNIIFFSIILLTTIPLITPGIPVTDDGLPHLLKIANLWRSIQDGQILPGWLGYLDFTYGSTALLFNWLLPYYFTLIFHFFGFSFTVSLKLVWFLSIIFTGYFFYLFMRTYFSPTISKITSLFYLFNPYYLFNIYKRGALGETTAYIFVPLLFFILIKIRRGSNKKLYWLGVITLFLLLLSHYPIAIPIVILWFFIGLFYAYIDHSPKIIFRIIFIAVSAFFLTIFYWLPRLVELQYTYLPISYNTIYLKHFFKSSAFRSIFHFMGNIVVLIGIIHTFIVTSLMFLMKLKRNKIQRERNLLSVIYICVFFFSLFLTTWYSRFLWKMFGLNFLFYPWRMLGIASFAASISAGFFLEKINSKFRYTFIITLAFLLIVTNFKILSSTNSQQYSDNQLLSYTSFSDSFGGFLPIWADPNQMYQFNQNPDYKPNQILTSDYEILISNLTRLSHKITFNYESKQTTMVILNTFYFPGWLGKIDDDNLELKPSADSYPKGIMQFTLPEGKHSVEIKFTQTNIRKLGYIISLLSFVMLISITFLINRNFWTKL